MTAGLSDYPAEEADALQEIVNVAMGSAACSLARVLDTFVRLPVPRVRLIRSANMLDTITALTGRESLLTVVRQAYTSSLHGEALVLFGPGAANDLGPFLGYGETPSRVEAEEIVLEISNILVGACLGGIAHQLSHEFVFSAPSLIGQDVAIEKVIDPSQLGWSRSLLVEVNFRLEERDFVCHILIFWPESSIDAVSEAIARLLEST